MYSNLMPYVKDRKPPEGAILNPHLEINRGLAGYWPMWSGSGNKVFDLSGNGKVGNITGDPIWIPGPFGFALSFDGDVDGIDTGKKRNFGQKFTLSVRLKFNLTASAGSKDHIIASRYLYDNEFSFSQYETTNQLRFTIGLGKYVYWTVPGGIDTSLWYHLVVVVDTTQSSDSDKVILYCNNIKLDQAGFVGITTESVKATGWNVKIADGRGYGNFNGLIDIPMLYNRAQSAGEIAELYREPFCGFRWESIIELASYVAGEPPTGIPILRRRRAG